MLPAVERAIEQRWNLWVPIVLHWGWEADIGWGELERLAQALAPFASAWEGFMEAAAHSREGDSALERDPLTEPDASGTSVREGRS